MKRSFLALSLLAATCLGGCVSLGLSQQQSETAYIVGAGITDGTILAGKLSPEYVGYACQGDNINYGILISTRNVADGVNHALADAAHQKLQSDGSRLSNVCTPT